MNSNSYIVIEHPISEFEQIELQGNDVRTVPHRQTVEEYKATLPDYNPGPVYTATAEERKRYESNPEAYAQRPLTKGAARAARGSRS